MIMLMLLVYSFYWDVVAIRMSFVSCFRFAVRFAVYNSGVLGALRSFLLRDEVSRLSVCTANTSRSPMLFSTDRKISYFMQLWVIV